MEKKDAKVDIIKDEEVEGIRSFLHQDAQDLFSRSLRGGIFGVYLEEGLPFYFVGDQLLAEYQCSKEAFLQTYSNGLLSTIEEDERAGYEQDLLQSLNEQKVFDRICKANHNSAMQYIHDIAKVAVLEDGTKIVLILRSNVSDAVEYQLRLEKNALFYEQENKKLEELTVKIPCAVCMLTIDEHFSLQFANEEFYRLLKYDAQTLKEEKDNHIDELIYDQDIEWLRERLAESIRAKEKEIELENRIVCRDGSVIWLLVKGYFTYYQESTEMICSFMDITKRKKTEEEMKISEARFRVALAITESTIFEYDIKTKVMVHGDRSAVAYGIQHITENVPESLVEVGIIHPDNAEAFLEMYQKIMDGAETAYCLTRTRLVEDGSYVWRKIIMTNIFDDNGKPVQAVGVLEDVDEQVKREEKLLYETERDALTGLYNRRFMESNIKKNLEDPIQQGYKAILIIDIDDFKRVNDTKGHLFGDFVLKESARRLLNLTMENAFVGRIGGDEFIAYCKHVDCIEQVESYASRLVESFTEVYKDQEDEMDITCSVGYAIFPNDGKCFEHLFQRADTALYIAKKSGKNKVMGYQE